MKTHFWGIVCVLFLASCNKENKVEQVERAFYYWKSDSSLDDKSVKEINELNVRKIYYKLFEIDYSETMGNYPFAKNSPSTYALEDLDSVTIVPTIFIKNGIFQYNDEKSLDKLADNIVFLIDKYHKEEYNEYNPKEELKTIFNYNEIQVDCDWTKSTKDKYFYLLKKIKELSHKQISCTLRLYPYKYPEIMGIPPVDKVSLMCYNLIKPLSEKDKNSILDINELKKYLDKRRSYPKHLDVALPVFYWTQLYQNNHFEELLDISSEDVKGFIKPIKPLWYEVTKDTSLNYDTYFKVGDQIKCEDVSKTTLDQAIALIKKNVVLDKNTTISLFHLDQSTFKKYNNEEISSFYSSFTK
ncbi:hypothetical protein [Flavobacterium terrigena]|uniref:Lipoprotein n=1 Tax=Flavobacterium terrigena TaxID=402734 RepID=A0A1H6QXY8_9FLAO|nr:hypothetical protein [Flavobacterium terrigena]SEI43822.1 hypothetical protein SAMN05660918_0573 [Flavobacterium terrigena]